MRRLMHTTMALPSIASRRLLEMLDEVLRDQLDALLGPDHRLQRRPLGLQPLLALDFLALGDLLELRVECGLRPSFKSSLARRLS